MICVFVSTTGIGIAAIKDITKCWSYKNEYAWFDTKLMAVLWTVIGMSGHTWGVVYDRSNLSRHKRAVWVSTHSHEFFDAYKIADIIGDL